MKKNLLITAMCLLTIPFAANAAVVEQQSVLKGDVHFLTGYNTHNIDGTVNVVVEIPAGTTAKYEVDHKTGLMVLEQKNGKPRYVQYIGYPGNYGLIPRTIQAKELGGDGDPLDAIVLGDPVARGSVIKARPIGVLKLRDHGEEDSKIIMGAVGSPFEGCSNLKDLDAKFPGVTKIIEIWFTHYKGYDKNGKLPMKSGGIGDRSAAIKIIGESALLFEQGQVKQSDLPKLDENGNPKVRFHPNARNITD